MSGRWLATATVAAVLGGSTPVPPAAPAAGAGPPCCSSAGHSCPLAKAARHSEGCALHHPSAAPGHGRGRHEAPCSISAGCEHRVAALPASGRAGLPPAGAAAPAPAWAGWLAPAAPPVLLGSRPTPDPPPPRPSHAV